MTRAKLGTKAFADQLKDHFDSGETNCLSFPGTEHILPLETTSTYQKNATLRSVAAWNYFRRAVALTLLAIALTVDTVPAPVWRLSLLRAFVHRHTSSRVILNHVGWLEIPASFRELRPGSNSVACISRLSSAFHSVNIAARSILPTSNERWPLEDLVNFVLVLAACIAHDDQYDIINRIMAKFDESFLGELHTMLLSAERWAAAAALVPTLPWNAATEAELRAMFAAAGHDRPAGVGGGCWIAACIATFRKEVIEQLQTWVSDNWDSAFIRHAVSSATDMLV